MLVDDTRSVPLRDGTTVELRPLSSAEHDALFDLFSDIVETGEGWPQEPPLTRAVFRSVWVEVTATVLAIAGGELAGAYVLKPNHPGRAALTPTGDLTPGLPPPPRHAEADASIPGPVPSPSRHWRDMPRCHFA